MQDARCHLRTHFRQKFLRTSAIFYAPFDCCSELNIADANLRKKKQAKKTSLKKRPIRGPRQQRVYKIRRTCCVKIFSQLSKKIHISVYKICTRFCPDFDSPQTNYIGMQLDRIQLFYSFFGQLLLFCALICSDFAQRFLKQCACLT